MAHKAVVAFVTLHNSEVKQKVILCEEKKAKQALLYFALSGNITEEARAQKQEFFDNLFKGLEDSEDIPDRVTAAYSSAHVLVNIIWIEEF